MWDEPLIRDLSNFRGNYAHVRDLDSLKRLIDLLATQGKTVAFDVETGYTGPNKKKASLDVAYPSQFITGFSITNSTEWARYVPLMHDFGETNLPPETVWELVKPLLEECELVCHNWVFEARNVLALDRKGHGPSIKLDWRKAHDSMIQSYTLSEIPPVNITLDPSHGLKDITHIRYNYEQMHLDDLFEKPPTKAQKDCIRFNTFDVTQKVVNYVCDDVCWALRLDGDQRERCQTERRSIYAVEREIAGILLDMAETGIAVDWDGITTDLGRFEYFYQQMESRTRRMFEEAAGKDLTTLNFRSAIQMRQLLFEDMGLKGTRMTKANKNGDQSLSTDETALEALRHQHPAVDQLLRYRQTKKMGEWFQLWSGLKTAYDERVHPSLNQVRVQSGRFASDAPNVQNITKKWWFAVTPRDFDKFPAGKDGDAAYEAHVRETGTNGIDYWAGNARDFLVASPGYRLLSFDYSQAELRMLAGLSEEPYLIEAFAKGIDIHSATAAMMFKKAVEDCGKDSSERAKGKTINFGLVFGMGPKLLGEQLGISTEEAQELFNTYFSAFTKVSEWFDKQKRNGQRHGYTESWLGRKATIWELRSPNRGVQAKADRMFVNVPVQGGAADYCKLAMIRSKRALEKRGWWGNEVRLLMNQHDSLVFEVSEALDLGEVRDLLDPQVSFAVPAFPTLPQMAVDWETGLRWGSVKSFEEQQAEPDPQPAEPSAPEEELDLPREVVIRLLTSPTEDQAKSFANALRAHPGEHSVRLVLGDRDIPVRGTRVSADVVDDLRHALGYDVELRQIA